MVRGVYLFPTTPQALRSRHVSVDPAIHKTRGCAAGSARTDRPFARNLPLLCRARQGMGRCSGLAIGLRKTIVENGTKRCSRMQTQVTGCSGVQHSRTGQVCDSSPRFKVNHSAKIAREPPDGKEKRGLGPPGSVQDLPASPPEASASKVTPLSGTPSPPKAKTSAQHCGTLPTSPRIPRILSQTPYGYVQPDSRFLGV
ncbi:hypothetical protein CPAR01_06973 [Colletotrichum paranaense]|uniref:Uncharacterized protein n=1 Tax=Colletotrichum paranaense TaxID=1914294 RepID=A0ABQ9SP19_9PEZI|nr:uncharacterized protein CPAR01_06973 [Colletotrichum paranaense]KAK1540984.1 hypothetical protein CPAR01_06973 [Colletotrichum paranaense]